MSDDTFCPSSPTTEYSQYFHEQSQHKQEIRDARRAEMTTEECESELAERRSLRKRVKLDHERAESPRASAVQSAVKTSSAFLLKGSLDSQSTSQEAIDALIAARIRDDTTSQDFLDQLDYRRQPVLYNNDDISEELDDYEALHARCTQAEAKRDEARGERNQALAELSSVQRAYDEMVVVKNCAEGQLACWKRAAISGLRCANSVENRRVAFVVRMCSAPGKLGPLSNPAHVIEVLECSGPCLSHRNSEPIKKQTQTGVAFFVWQQPPLLTVVAVLVNQHLSASSFLSLAQVST
ncbi:hypothetical protein B0H12DRAFT_1078798 [Mycena haematopus]|nr:hypothetical protein B0H12DRAFT_1078798 [Mycena haematopus]